VSSHPIDGAPATVWAGNYDAQTLANSLGAPWAAPIFAIHQPRIVDIATLCASPPPVAAPFTTTDVANAFVPFRDNSDILTKLRDVDDQILWTAYCEYDTGPPPPPYDPGPPPDGLPDGAVPPTDSESVVTMLSRLKWLTEQIVPRLYVDGARIVATGSGSAFVPSRTDGHWETWAAGFRWRVDEKADFEAHIGDSPNAMWWDLGWITIGSSAGVERPMRVQREFGSVYGYLGRMSSISWTLPPDVTLSIWPLMPLTDLEPG
jgi:hypothetical protein